MKDKERKRYLLKRYLAAKETDDEWLELIQAIDAEEDRDTWIGLFQQLARQHPGDIHYEAGHWEHMLNSILGGGDQARPGEKRRRLRPPISLSRIAAALIILVASAGAWYGVSYIKNRTSNAEIKADVVKNDVLPGGNKARLTLSNGSVVILNNIHNGALARQGGSVALKVHNGLLVYHSRIAARTAALTYNTISTPRGGQYQLVLPDGTKVWLNAASSLRFPTAFPAHERRVSLTGEAYFEVAHKDGCPFRVDVGNEQVEDLGTHFDIMAYSDEAEIKTTLLEGAIKVSKGAEAVTVAPGGQAVLYKGSDLRLINKVDVNEVVAWKNGFFEFESADVGDVMRRLSRWYDVSIIYAGGIPPGHITGRMPRNTNLSSVLQVMQLSGIHFTIEGRKVIVLPE